MIQYGVPQYKVSQVAEAAGLNINTAHAYIHRGDFRIIGKAERKGPGVATKLTLEDAMCWCVASRLITLGVPAKPAFDAACGFAYGGNEDRLPAQMATNRTFTMLIYWTEGSSAVIGTDDGVGFADLFRPIDEFGRMPPRVILLNEIERRVFWALRIGQPDYTR